MSAKKDALKFLLKRLANKTGATPEEIPMSISEPRLMEDLRRGLAPMIPGGPYKRGEASRLDIKFPIQIKPKTKEPSVIKKPVTEKSSDSKKIIQYRRDDGGNVQIITKDMVKLTPDGKPKRTKDGELIFKTSEKQKTKTKTKTQKELPATKTKTMPANPNSTILVVNPKGGQSNERKIKKAIVENLGKKPPLTGKPKFKVPTEQKKPEYPFTPVEAVQQKTDEGLVTILRERISPSPKAAAAMARRPDEADVLPNIVQTSDRSGVRPVVVGTKISRETGKRLGQRKPYDTGVIYDEQPMPGVNVNYPDRPSSRRKHPDDKGFAESGFIKGGDVQDSTRMDSPSKVPVTESKLNPVEKEAQTAKLDLKKITEEEFYALKFQEGLDETGSIKDAANYAEQAVLARDLNQNFTASQIANFMKPKSKPFGKKKAQEIKDDLESTSKKGTRSKVSDEVSPSRQAQVEGGDVFKKGGQIKKPVKNKRKIKTSVRGNDLVAMMYD